MVMMWEKSFISLYLLWDLIISLRSWAFGIEQLGTCYEQLK